MANNSAIVNTNQGHFQQPNSAHHCKECGLFFDSAKSLEVHLQYHKENLLNKWASQAAGHGDQETNNNGTKASTNQPKREFNNHAAGTIAAAADSSDAMLVKSSNKSPDSYTSRTTPETSTTSFGHPPTPQSYHSAPSPYQNHGETQNNQFSPSYQGQQQFQPVKTERTSPALYGGYQQHMYADQYFSMEPQPQVGYPQDYPVHKIPTQNASFRYHPYGHHPSYERSPQVSSSSPAYPSQNPQPTPSPSPKQCDKCGCVCDSAAQLIEHLNHAHPPTPAPTQHMQFGVSPGTPVGQHQFTFPGLEAKKGEEEPQTEILDLDSHKVHHVFQTPEEEEEMKRNGELSAHGNPHSVTAMLNPWPGHNSPTHKMFPGAGPVFPGMPVPEVKHQPPPQHQMFPQMHHQDYIVQAGATTTEGNGAMLSGPMTQYRPFEHLPPQPTPQPVISSSGAGGPPPAAGKGANWKSNEARRPKTYNCSACNKWFTSSGHLKRHYNTTLHKNAVKSSGQPDPATMPISAHHHPGRDERSTSRGPEQNHRSPDSAEDTSDPGYERSGGLLQQPPSGPYDRQPQLNLGPGPPQGINSPMGGSPQHNTLSGSPPNGEAGPSASHDHLSRGLLSISTVNTLTSSNSSQQQSPMGVMPTTTQSMQGFSLYNQGTTPVHSPTEDTSTHHLQPAPPMPQYMQQQMQNYPNGPAPHVTPTATNNQPGSTSLTTTGEQQQHQQQQMQYALSDLYGIQLQPQVPEQYVHQPEQQPLPSFAQFQTAHHRYGILLAAPGFHQLQQQANVGGASPVTDSNSLYQPQQHMQMMQQMSPGSPYGEPSPASSYGSPAYRHLGQDEDYEITVLENAAEYSPPQLHQLVAAAVQEHPMGARAAPRLPLPPSPPEAAQVPRTEPKHDYEHGSPQITSTGSPASHKTPGGGGNGPNSQHKCFDCDKVFNKACYLTQHNKTFHSGDKPFKCHRCGKRFPSDPSYQEHLAKHAGDKPYKCELCPKQFNHKTDLRRHMCLHTGQKPYACEHCGKGFIRKDHMLKHAETHSRKSQGHAAKHAAQQAAAVS